MSSRSSSEIEKTPGKGIDQWYGDWHLASTPHDARLTELEFALLRCREAFDHFVVQGAKAASDLDIGAADAVMLHVIRMHERAKSAQTIARLLNRDDIQNVQYSLRKLIAQELVRKTRTGKTIEYAVTESGSRATDRFAHLKGLLLSEPSRAVVGIEEKLVEAAKLLMLMTGLYEEAARTSATYRATETRESNGKSR